MRKFLFALWTASTALSFAAPSVLLWYRQPAEKWVEALPIGNGRLGAVVFGKIADERIQLNEDTVWSGERRDRTNPAARKAVPEIRRLLFAGKVAEGFTIRPPPGTTWSFRNNTCASWSRSSRIRRGIWTSRLRATGINWSGRLPTREVCSVVWRRSLSRPVLGRASSVCLTPASAAVRVG